MAYQTGTVSDLPSLVTVVNTFSQSNGWTLLGGVLNKDNVQIELGHDGTNFYGMIGRGAASASLTNAGNTNIDVCNSPGFYILKNRNSQTMEFPITYHLIALENPANIFLVVNYNVVHCQHMAFGNIEKYGTWDGGEFISATVASTDPRQNELKEHCFADSTTVQGTGAFLFVNESSWYGQAKDHRPSCLLYTDLDGHGWINTNQSSQYQTNEDELGYFNAANMSRPHLTHLNTVNLQPAMYPPVILKHRPGYVQKTPMGLVPHVRYLRVDYYEPGDIVAVGDQKWIVFPHTSVAHSNSGWAIKYDGP